MGRQAGTTAEASFDPQFIVEKFAIHQYVPHGTSFICSDADHGALLRSLV